MLLFIILLFNGFGLTKVVIFTTNVKAENQCLINLKSVCDPDDSYRENHHFCQTCDELNSAKAE